MKYTKLCESLTQMKTTKITRYPKQIKLSEAFLAALQKEVENHRVIDESKEIPIRNVKEKFSKALQFHLKEIQEGCSCLIEEPFPEQQSNFLHS